ncbi:MAG: VWA domain-containing protein [Deltaproteobacteria bacterium]|nr:VWA domain-containing protein [Deltaproteobacteria bacterium]
MRGKNPKYLSLQLTALQLSLLAACSDTGLEPVQKAGPPPVDDKLALTGSICTKVPEDALFPVKILLVIDTSYSMRVTDPAQQRVRAVQQLIDRYAGNPSVEFAVIAFDAVVSNITDGFTSTPDLGRISGRLDDSDRLTDYQGALGAAYAVLSKDMIESSPAERARSKYVVVFFSDGVPDPQCYANQPPVFANVCNVDRDEWPDTFDLPPGTNPNTGAGWTWDDFQGLYPDLDAGKDYNTPNQLRLLVEDILELQEIFNVNEVRVHTGFLFDPNVGQAYITAFNLNRPVAIDLMQQMADAGNGTFTEFTSGGDINFLNINYAAVKRTYSMSNFLVFNSSAVPRKEGADQCSATIGDGEQGPAEGGCPACRQNGPKAADSDGDGLPDEQEDVLRLCASEKGGATCNLGGGNFRNPKDSDEDGYSDLFETRFASSGFDAAVRSPVVGDCGATEDSDGDGLLDCEEIFLQTDPRLFDTDRDRIPDGLEVRFELDPAKREDAVLDDDADGTLNGEEVLIQWSPKARELAHALPPRYEYTVTGKGETPEGQTCYDFEVTDMELETTRAIDPTKRGLNRTWLWFVEGPPDDPRDYGSARVACVESRYVCPDLKVPASGSIELVEGDFHDPTEVGFACVRGCSSDTDCKEVSSELSCQRTHHRCVPKCTADTDCKPFGGDLSCKATTGKCVAGAAGP